MRSLPVAALVVLFTVLLGTPSALAHTELQTSIPAAGARLAAPPSTVSLTFGEAVRLPANPIRVAGPEGVVWTVGPATASGATVTAPVTATGPAGAYTLTWQVISDDGDTIRGTVRFTLTAPAAPIVAPASPPGPAAAAPAVPTTAPPPATPAAVPSAAPQAVQTTEEGGVPGWLWVVAGAAVLAVGAGVAVARRARQP